MLQAGFGCNVLGSLHQFPVAQRPQQITSQDHLLPAPLGQPLFFEEVGALLQGFLDLGTKAQIAQPTAAADQLLVELRGVALSTGSACSSATPAPSHVLTALGLPAARVRASVRMGLGRFTTREEVDVAADRLVACVEKLRSGVPRKAAPTPLPSAGSKS